jgi:hypothetical protein
MLKNRLPPRQDLLLVFIGCAFPIHVWALLNLFYIIPAWVLRMNLSQLTGSIDYLLVFALLESVVIWGILVLAALALPQAWLRQKFLAQSTTLVLVTTFWSIVVHLNYEFLVSNRGFLVVVALAYLVSAGVCHILAGRSPRLGMALRNILDRLTVLSFLYIFFDIVGLLVVIARNI